LLNIYIKAEGIKTKQYPILKISDEPEIDNISTIKYLLRSYLRDIYVKLSAKII